MLRTVLVACALGPFAVASGADLPPPVLSAPGTAVVGESVTFVLQGTTPLPPIPELLLLDPELAPVPLPLPPYGELHLALSGGLQVLVGDGSSLWTVPIPDDPGLVGLELHGQALGLVYQGFVGELLLSGPTTVELLAEPPAAVRLAAVASLLEGTIGMHAVDVEGATTRHFGLAAPGGSLRALAAAPDGRHLYAVDATAGRLYAFDVDPEEGDWDPSTSLSIAPGSLDVLVEPLGRFLYTASTATGAIEPFVLDALGDPQPGPPSSPGGPRATALAADPQGRFLFAAAPLDGVLAALSIDPQSGALSTSALLPSAGSPARVAVGAGGERLYVLSAADGLVTTWAFDPESGQFGAPVGAPVAVGGSVVDLALDPEERRLYLLDAANSALVRHAVDPTTGGLVPTPEGSTPTAAGALRLALDARGERLFVAGLGENELWLHAPDPTTGEPAFVQRLRQRRAPVDLALLGGSAPTEFRSRVLLAGYAETAEVRPSQLDLGSGQVFDLGITGPTDATGPHALALDRRSGNLLSAQAFGGVKAFVFNVQNTNLTAVGAAAPGSGPLDVAIEPGGRFAWTLETGPDRLRAFELQGGVPIELGPVELPTVVGPRAVAISPDGGRLAVVGADSRSLDLLAIDAAGATTPLGSATFDGAPVAVTFEPAGRFALVVTQSPNRLVALALAPSSGAPTEVAAVNTGQGPIAVAASPSGREVFVANAVARTITAVRLDPQSGQLSVAEQQGLAEAPTALVVDASGAALIVAVGSIDLFQQFAIDPATGTLEGTGLSLSVGAEPTDLAVTVELD